MKKSIKIFGVVNKDGHFVQTSGEEEAKTKAWVLSQKTGNSNMYLPTAATLSVKLKFRVGIVEGGGLSGLMTFQLFTSFDDILKISYEVNHSTGDVNHKSRKVDSASMELFNSLSELEVKKIEQRIQKWVRKERKNWQKRVQC